MPRIRLKKGYDIPLEGKPDSPPKLLSTPPMVGFMVEDFLGIKLQLTVKEGDKVKIGTPLLRLKQDENQIIPSLGGGQIIKIIRGERRRLIQIVIQLDLTEAYEIFPQLDEQSLAQISQEDLIRLLAMNGGLIEFRERPFNYLASCLHRPRDVFISTLDSAPLAPQLINFLPGHEQAFRLGLQACSRLTSGKVYLISSPHAPLEKGLWEGIERIEYWEFEGPHPVGEPGVHIHHLAPIRHRQDIVWWLRLPGVIRLGKLLQEGKWYPQTIFSLSGPGCRLPSTWIGRLGCPLHEIVSHHIQEGPIRIIRGNVLTGKKASIQDFLGIYDSQITLIPEPTTPEFMGWARPGLTKRSWYPAFLGNLFGTGKVGTDTRIHGGQRAFIFNDVYEEVVPMDILPIFLIKSCIYKDIEEMEQLGIYEVCEEELALCEYICPSKIPFQKILREAINFLEKEG